MVHQDAKCLNLANTFCFVVCPPKLLRNEENDKRAPSSDISLGNNPKDTMGGDPSQQGS